MCPLSDCCHLLSNYTLHHVYEHVHLIKSSVCTCCPSVGSAQYHIYVVNIYVCMECVELIGEMKLACSRKLGSSHLIIPCVVPGQESIMLYETQMCPSVYFSCE